MTGKRVVVVGAQWGDEGKGKIVDWLAEEADVIVRFNGGANAGHTIWVDGKKTVLHLLPSSITRPGKLNLVGPYVVVDPEMLALEIDIARQADATVLLDPRCQVVLPLHKQIDALREGASGTGAIGTTGKGIGPAYEDLAARRGPTLGDLVKPERFAEALAARNFLAERDAVIRHYGGTSMTALALQTWAARFAERIGPLVDDANVAHRLSRTPDKHFLFEGAQSVMLDILNGTRPYVTSSFCGPGAISASLGIHRFDRVIGVAKGYATRVGGGPFPTESPDKFEWLRTHGSEFGATTGRPRRCGWIDLPALRYACAVGGITELVITKIDVLRGLEAIPVCRAYHLGDGTPVEPLAFTTKDLEIFQPVYETLPGWSEDISGCRSWDDLPENVRAYLDMIAREVGVPVTGTSVGPEREQMIWV